jgi:hypothetical protein
MTPDQFIDKHLVHDADCQKGMCSPECAVERGQARADLARLIAWRIEKQLRLVRPYIQQLKSQVKELQRKKEGSCPPGTTAASKRRTRS